MSDVDLSHLNDEERELAEILIIEEAEYQRYHQALASFHKSAYPWQKNLVNVTKDLEHRIVGAIAGNRTGKTYSICGMIASHLTGIYPRWWRGKRFSKPIKAYFAGKDSNHNRRTPQDYLFGTSNRRMTESIGTGFLPRDVIVPDGMVIERGGAIKSAQIRHKSGGLSSFEFVAYSQGADAVQGFDGHLVVVDEQPPDEFFAEIVKRTMVTDQGPGLVYCGFTPLHGRTPLIDKMWDIPRDFSFDKEFIVKSGKMIPKEDLKMDAWKGMERWAVINVGWDGVPHLTQQEMDETLAAAPVYQHDAIRNGVPVGGHGRVYPHDQAVISYNPSNTPIQSRWKHIIGVDIGFGTRDPAAGVLMAWDEENDTIFITDEFKRNVFTEREMAQSIWSLDKDVPVAWPDDANRKGFQGQSTVKSLLDDLDVNLLPVHFQNPSGMRKGGHHKKTAPGFSHINSRFYSSRLKINKNCHLLLKEMDNYQYKDGASTSFIGEHHLLDAMRYGVMMLIQDYGEARNLSRTNWRMEESEYEQFENWGVY